MAIFKLEERQDFKVTSLNNVHANIKKQGSHAKQECELQHGYPYKWLKVGMEQSVQNLSLSKKHISPLFMCSFGPHSDIIWCDPKHSH